MSMKWIISLLIPLLQNIFSPAHQYKFVSQHLHLDTNPSIATLPRLYVKDGDDKYIIISRYYSSLEQCKCGKITP